MGNYSYIILSALPMFVCLFWTVVFLLRYRQARKDQRILFWFMLTASVLYMAHFVFFNKIFLLLPVTDTLYNFATLAVYPIYYLYILSLTQNVSWKQLTILLPALLLSVLIGILYGVMPEGTVRPFLLGYEYSSGTVPEDWTCTSSVWIHNLVKAVFAVQLVPILLCGLKKIRTFKNAVARYFSNTEKNDLKEVRLLLVFFVITSVFSFIANLIGRVFFADSIALVAIPSLLFSALLFAVGYVGMEQRFTVDDLNRESVQEEEPLQKNSSLRRDMDELMEKDKLFLQPNLKLSDLAAALNTNRTYIYNSLMSDEAGERLSFSDYVNRYRIMYSLGLLEHNGEGKTIEDVIYESGFASKAAFYNNFRKFTGKSPHQYLKECR